MIAIICVYVISLLALTLYYRSEIQDLKMRNSALIVMVRTITEQIRQNSECPPSYARHAPESDTLRVFPAAPVAESERKKL